MCSYAPVLRSGLSESSAHTAEGGVCSGSFSSVLATVVLVTVVVAFVVGAALSDSVWVPPMPGSLESLALTSSSLDDSVERSTGWSPVEA